MPEPAAAQAPWEREPAPELSEPQGGAESGWPLEADRRQIDRRGHSGWSTPLGIDIPEAPSSWDDEPAEMDDEPVSLGHLTPQAARAIAAAASAATDHEREAAIAEAIAANDHPLDRATLLRFLASVRR
jgi:hypothetical protein